MKKSLFATLVMFLSMALMAGGAGAQNFAFTDMSEVEHISVADGKITVKKTDGSSNTLVSTHPGTVEYQFNTIVLGRGFSDADLQKAIAKGRVKYVGNDGWEFIDDLVQPVMENDYHIQELVIEGNFLMPYWSTLANFVNTIKVIGFIFSNPPNFYVGNGVDLKSIYFSNVQFSVGLSLEPVGEDVSIVFDNCTFGGTVIIKGGSQKVVDELKAFFEENGVEYQLY